MKSLPFIWTSLSIGLAWCSPAAVAVEVVTADHPGGNIKIEKIDGPQVRLASDLRDIQPGQKWFYWNFRARNTTPIEVSFTNRDNLGVNGPAFSLDGGVTWEWLGREKVTESPDPERANGKIWSFSVPAVAPDHDVRYSFCPQYLESHLHDWLEQHQGAPQLQTGTFTHSKAGREVEWLKITDPPTTEANPSKPLIVLIARQHACETMASYLLEGFLEASLGDNAIGESLRKNWEIVAIPFMDKDGVEQGDQGKNRSPHDHNRDYNPSPIYPEVAALINYLTESGRQVAAFFDLHCPAVHGSWDNRTYLVGSPDLRFAARQASFVESLLLTQQGDVRLQRDDLLTFGTAWNTNTNYSAGKNASAWARENLPEASLVTTVELPYASSRGVPVTATSARALGHDFAAALLDHLGKEKKL